MMKIPTSVPLLGHTIQVKIITKAEEWEPGSDVVGLWHPQNNAIYLRGDLEGTCLEQTFFHELMHAALDMMAHKLSRNEAFVDTLSSLLHQALTGAKYGRHR